MASTKLFFRSSRPTLPRAARAVRVRSGHLAVFLVAGALVAATWFFFSSQRNDDIQQLFLTHQADFERLKNMVAEEPSLLSVGVDNVGDYWLFDGRWTASGSRFVTYSRNEMLEAAGLTPSRYEKYLQALSAVNAFRVSRPQAKTSAPGTLHLFPVGKNTPGLTRNILFSTKPPEPLLTLGEAGALGGPRVSYARLADGWYVEIQRH